jgi:cytochrome c-type biogenesis protein
VTLLVISFLAGVLTVLAPCVLPLLPVVVGGSIAGEMKAWYRPFVIAGSLAVSVVIFTLILKATTVLLGVPVVVWNLLSGLIVVGLGLGLTFPKIWGRLVMRLGLSKHANALMGKSLSRHGMGRDVLIGASLGPVFNSCSPTYALIVATVLPGSFLGGLAYLIAYALGLAGSLLVVSLAGQAVVGRLAKASNPEGWLMRGIGVALVLVGLAVVFGLDKRFQAYTLEQGWYSPISNFEESLR